MQTPFKRRIFFRTFPNFSESVWTDPNTPKFSQTDEKIWHAAKQCGNESKSVRNRSVIKIPMRHYLCNFLWDLHSEGIPLCQGGSVIQRRIQIPTRFVQSESSCLAERLKTFTTSFLTCHQLHQPRKVEKGLGLILMICTVPLFSNWYRHFGFTGQVLGSWTATG